MSIKSTVVGAAKGRGRLGMILLVAFAVAVVAPFFTMLWAVILSKLRSLRGTPAAGTGTTSTPTEG